MFDFYILTKDDCIWCDKAKAILEREGFSYQEVKYDGSPMAKLLMKTNYWRTVPQILDSGYEHIGGYDSLEGHLLGNYKS